MTTATARITKTIAKYRADLLAHEAQAEHALQTAHNNTLAAIQPRLDALYREIQSYIDRGVTVPPEFLYEKHRLKVLQQWIQGQIDHYGALAQLTTRQLQQVGVDLGTQAARDMLQSTVPRGIQYSFGVPSTKAIANIVGATQAGSPLADLFNGFGAEAAQKVSQVLITGLTLGDNPRDVAPRVQQALGISRNRALTLARDQLNNAYRRAAVETYRANDDVVDGMVRIADLSTRSCAACIALQGKVYKLDEDPGFHPCDRCSLAPLTKSWDSILGPLGIDTSDLEDTRLDIQSGSDWFDQQDESTQRAILGNKGYEIWSKNDDVTLQSFVTHTYDKDWGASVQVTPLKDLVK